MHKDLLHPSVASVFPGTPPDALDTLLSHLYDGVMAPEGFACFVETLAAIFRLKATTMVIHNAMTHEIRGLWLYGISAEWSAKYALEFAQDDTLARHIGDAPIARFYASNLDIPHDEQLVHTRFYTQWLRPQNIATAAGGIILREGDWCTQIIVQRTPAQGPFDRNELRVFDQLMPHMRRAIQMRERMASLQHGQNILSGGLDMLAIPTVLFDEHGQVAHLNRRAAAVLKQPGPLWIEGRQLTTSDITLSRKLHFEISNAIAASRGAQTTFSDVVHVPGEGRVPLILMIAPMRTPASSSRIHGAALLFIFDPTDTRPLTAEALRKLFRLTQAEAELGVALCAGKTLEQTADERGVSSNTVRSQLKTIFLKTGTTRQAELVSLILSSPAYLIADQDGAANV